MFVRFPAAISAAILGLPTALQAQVVDLQQLSTTFSNPIGIDYHETSDSLILSANYSTGQPHNLETILLDGTHVQFSALAGATDELKIATVRSAGNPGGFVVGDLFTGNGVDGQILRITDGGATIINPWVDLPGTGNGLMRGSLYIDRTGVFGGDLIAVTTAGEVWRIDAAGSPTFLVDLNVHLEGLITVPPDPLRFGPIAGTILVGAEDQILTHSIDVSGNVTSYSFGVRVEDIDIIQPNESFIGVNFGTGRLLAAAPSSFAGLAGDILLTQESHSGSGLFHLSWDGSAYQVTHLPLAAGSQTPGQWEHVTFAPVGIIPFPDCAVTPSAALTTMVGVPVSFQVTGVDASSSDTVTLDAIGLPAGALATPALPASGNPVMVQVDWTPDGSQVGSHVIVFTATDSSGLETQCPVTIDVTSQPCVTLNFDLEDDFATPLVNGQHIDTEFGLQVTLSSSGTNSGLAIFDSTIGGPNTVSQDPDLLVGTGNLLILQTENLPPDGDDVFPRPNDDSDGGTMTFEFTSEVVLASVRLVDADLDGASNFVVLTDALGLQRTYQVPTNWTGDRTLGQPGEGTLDLMTLASQPGFASSATATEDQGFDDARVVRLDVHLAGSGAVDDLAWCPTSLGLVRSATSVRNGSGMNPVNLNGWTPPLVGGTWVAGLDCAGHASGLAMLALHDTALDGVVTAFGERLVGGSRHWRGFAPHSGGAVYFSLSIPADPSLSGLTVFGQGFCGGAPGIVLSNALDLVLGY